MNDDEPTTDLYDPVLRAMESGLLITVNCSSPSRAMEFGEMEVVTSRDDKTQVDLDAGHEEFYRIHRDRRDELVIAESTKDGLRRGHTVETVEVVGIGGED